MDEKQSSDITEAVPAATVSASDTFCNLMTNMISQADVRLIHETQLEALSTFEKTNEKFDRFNRLSAERYSRLHDNFQNHTKMLLDMKKDLDIVFRRIRNLKTKLSKQYVEAFTATSKSIHHLEESLEAETETPYVEEKPETEQLTSKTTATYNASQHQDLSNIQNIHTGTNKMDTNISKVGNPSGEVNEESLGHQTRTAFESKLIPQLSSSDESYGVQDTDTDDDNYGKDDENSEDDGDDYSQGDTNDIVGDDSDDGDVKNVDSKGNGSDDDDDNDISGGDDDARSGDDVSGGDDNGGNDDDNGNGDINNDNKVEDKTKEFQNNTQSSNLNNPSSLLEEPLQTSSNEASNTTNENFEQNENVGIHQQFPSSDESLESDSIEEGNDTTKHEDTEQTVNTSNEKNP